MGFWDTVGGIALAPVTGGASLLPGAGDFAGNVISGGGTGASQQQQAQIQAAMALQKQMYEQSRSDRMPWMDAGRNSLYDLYGKMQGGDFDTQYSPINASSLANDPGYQFRMQQGQQALERSAAARGGIRGGGFAKALDRYGQGFASNEYQNAWQRNMVDFQARQENNQNRFNRYFNMSGMGANAAAGLGTLGAGYANSMGSLYGAMGNAQAAGTQSFWGGLDNLGKSAVSMGMGGMGGGSLGSMAGYGGGGQALSGGPLMGGNIYGGNFSAPQMIPGQG